MPDSTTTARSTTATKSAPTTAKPSVATPAQPAKRVLTADDVRRFDAAPVVEPFTTSMLSAAERAQAEAAASAATALTLKGLLHRLDPATYVAPASAKSPEGAAIAAARDISAAAFTRMTPRLRALAADPARIKRVLGASSAVDLRRPSLGLTLARPIAGVDALQRVEVGDGVDAVPVSSVSARANATVRAAAPAKYSRMDLVLRAVHCVDETNPESGDDDIVLGGVIVGASGNTKVQRARFIGNFDDGDYVSLGELPFGQYSLRATSGYPKTMYCIFQLVESDQDDAEAARELTSALQMMATIAVSALASPAAGAVAGAIVSTIGGLVSLFIDDDAFPPYGIRVTLHSENQFGSDADSGQLRTGNITGHGGTYRIGYRWLLNA